MEANHLYIVRYCAEHFPPMTMQLVLLMITSTNNCSQTVLVWVIIYIFYHILGVRWVTLFGLRNQPQFFPFKFMGIRFFIYRFPPNEHF